MYIGSRHNFKIMNDDLPVVINNQLVPRERSFTCLGVKLDETLEWNEHIEVICKKVAAGIGMMKRIKPFVPANTLQTIYQALIQPYFDYCLITGDVCSKQLKDKLQRFQNRAARIIAGASFETRSADVLRSLAWDDLETRRCTTKSILLYKVILCYRSKEMFNFQHNSSYQLLLNNVINSEIIIFSTQKYFIHNLYMNSGVSRETAGYRVSLNEGVIMKNRVNTVYTLRQRRL